MPKFTISFFSVLFAASSALAMTCLNDYSGSGKGCAKVAEAAGDCSTLGYSTHNVSGCTRYLYCPFDSTYKRCVAKDGGSTTCNETTEFSVCQTNDTCLGGNDLALLGGTGSKCYYCKDGFEYKTSMTGYKQKPTGDLSVIRNYIYGVKPSNWTANGWETLNVAGCQCIKKWGCEDYPLLTSSVDAVNVDELKSCPTLAKCGTCTDTCGNKYAKITSCAENAELVNGVCQCKEGYYQENGRCVTCSTGYNTLDAFVWKFNGIKNVKLRYWLGIASGSSFDRNYIMLASPIAQPEGSGGLGMTTDPGDGGVITGDDDGRSKTCSGRTLQQACSCYQTAKAFADRVNKHNKNCPTMKVDMPTVMCGSVCTNNGGDHDVCFGSSCGNCESQGMLQKGTCDVLDEYHIR